MVNLPLIDWAKKCQKADTKAQRSLYDLSYTWMLGIGKRYITDWHSLEDVLSMAYVKVFENIQNIHIRDESSFRAWMKRILINECLMELRKNKIPFQAEEQLADLTTTDDALHTLHVKELILLLEHLPTGYKTVFNLYIFDQWTHKEIGQMLGISEQTSKSQLHKAKKQLQELIKNHYHE